MGNELYGISYIIINSKKYGPSGEHLVLRDWRTRGHPLWRRESGAPIAQCTYGALQ